MTQPPATAEAGAGPRHVTILWSELSGLVDLYPLGDVAVARLTSQLLTLQECVVTRDGAGRPLRGSGLAFCAVFENASAALNRALEIQRVASVLFPPIDSPNEAAAKDSSSLAPGDSSAASAPRTDPKVPGLRMGLHMGEVQFIEAERIEIISRQIHRARCVMEAAAPGQILASESVVEAGRDFVDLPHHLSIQYYGEYYLKGAGPTNLCEITDVRLHPPTAPNVPEHKNWETAVLGRLELGGFHQLTRLGEGASGVVYQGVREDTATAVAIKVLPAYWGDSPEARRTLAQDLALLQRLALPGLALVLEHHLDHHPPFVVMELVAGKPLTQALDGAAPLRVARVFHALCGILEQAHAAGLVHGHLSPANLLLRGDDSPVILDFGLGFPAPDAADSLARFAPAYLAPETIAHGIRNASADLYALGAVLFQVLTGRTPFAGRSVHEIVQGHLHEDPPLPSTLRAGVPDGLQRICLKALEKNPLDRYPSLAAMAVDLDHFIRGDRVRTRPNAYDNLLLHRVQKHVNSVEEWQRGGLLSQEETDRLLSAYQGLQRLGIPAVMEGQRYRVWQTLVYVGGWAVINGSLLWLIQDWQKLTRAGRLGLGCLPALTAFALGAIMWRLERFRLAFVALVVGILAVPLPIGVWLHEFKIAAAVAPSRLPFELFHTTVDTTALTNAQLTLIALGTAAVALVVMLWTRTKTHSAQALAAAVLLYTTVLLLFGLKLNYDHHEWAKLAIQFVPLLVAQGWVATRLLAQPDRAYQAPPWIYFSAVLLPTLAFCLSFYGLTDWTSLEPALQRPASLLLLSLAGVLLVAVGLRARAILRHRCRLASWLVTVAGLGFVLAGLAAAGWNETWPRDWWSPRVFGQPVPVPHLVLPGASLLIALLACRYQWLAFLLVGLAGFAGSVHLLGQAYFSDISAWPKTIMMSGVICFFGALYLEIRHSRGNAMDDVVRQNRL